MEKTITISEENAEFVLAKLREIYGRTNEALREADEKAKELIDICPDELKTSITEYSKSRTQEFYEKDVKPLEKCIEILTIALIEGA